MSPLSGENYIVLLNGFIEELKQRGFVIGVDQHLRVHALLMHLGPDCKPGDLKFILCPLLATNEEEQGQFYRAFDRYFSFLERPSPEKAKKEDVRQKAAEEESHVSLWERRWIYVLLGSIFLFSIGVIIYMTRPQPSPKAPEQPISLPSKPKPPFTEPGEKVPESPEKSHTGEGQIPFPKPSDKPENKPTPKLPEDYITTLRRHITKVKERPSSLYKRYGYIIYWLLIIAPWIIVIMILLYRYKHSQLVLHRQRSKKPPFVWPIRVDPPDQGFLKQREFYAAVHLLRQRLPGDIFLPDVEHSLRDTINAAGFPLIRYRALTRPPEYLILIDLSNRMDHHSRFMATIADALEDEGIFVSRFFYKDDPQVCFRDPGGKRELLSDLGSKFNNCRLILAGTGDGLLAPLSGRLDEWTEVFRHWPEKAILTPRMPQEWGMHEVTLAQEFILLPATLDGLASLVDHFEAPSKMELRPWVNADSGEYPLVENKPVDIKALREWLVDEHTFQWLCACAVYPELHWNLTLYLAAFLDHPITPENLMRLIRLPWFQTGRMPEEMRLKLIGELDEKKLSKIRQAIITVLEKNPPPRESAAWDAYQLYLAVHQDMLPRKKRKQLKEIARNVSEHQIQQDYPLLQILESAPFSPLIQRLPKWLYKSFFKNGLPLFGLKTGIYVIIAFILSLTVFLTMRPVPPMPSIPIDKTIIVRSINYAMVYIPPGTFMMGSPVTERGRDNDETQHEVTITKGFYLGATEVTQGQWESIMGNNPSYFKRGGDDCPVESVSWFDCQEFIQKLNEKEGIQKYRLPTEAEWEYACRAGSTTAIANGRIEELYCEKEQNLDKIGWYCGNSVDKTHPVAKKLPNVWGLYDMHGNVWEWCQDWYGEFPLVPLTDPVGFVDSSSRVRRGGGWSSHVRYCRSACRFKDWPVGRADNLGFRLARTP